MKKSLLSATATLMFAESARALTPASPIDVKLWLAQESPKAEAYLKINVSPNLPGYAPGFVMAAPWVVPGVQDYRFHWIRDAALVMNVFVTRYHEASGQARSDYFSKLKHYLNFSKLNQIAPEPADVEKVGLGEVKFNPDGTRFVKWMRPQNDGPALRAVTIARFARLLWHEGRHELVRHLYDGGAPGSQGIQAGGVLKADLDYLATHWADGSYDPWEEVKGHHFYTRLVQRKALLGGASLAELLGAPGDAKTYREVARKIEVALEAHWIPVGGKTPLGDTSAGQIWDTFDRTAGVDYKSTGLDVSVVLGALHAHDEGDAKGDRFFSASDDRILQTSLLLSKAFHEEFPLAKDGGEKEALGTPIGRYPKDRYNGYDASKAGNPWYLATTAFAELYYRCAEEWQADGKIVVTPVNAAFLATLGVATLKTGETVDLSDPRFSDLLTGVRALGDRYLRRVIFHQGEGGHFTEQFLRDTGKPDGAQDLSWSYAAILTAGEHRR